jgi:hypothetical protein
MRAVSIGIALIGLAFAAGAGVSVFALEVVTTIEATKADASIGQGRPRSRSGGSPLRDQFAINSSCSQVRGGLSISGLETTARVRSNLNFPFE